MIDKDTKSALLFFVLEFGLVAAAYLLVRAATGDNGFAAGMLALPVGIAAIGVYIVNVIFIIRLMGEAKSSKQPNRQALRLAIGTAVYPLFVVLFYLNNTAR